MLLGTETADSAASEAAGVPVRGLSALVLLSNRPGRGVDWLYQRLGISQSGAVRLVDRLEASGLVRRERVPGRREVALYVTEAGQSRLSGALRAREAATERLLRPLSSKELERLTALLAKILAGEIRRRKEADIVCRLCNWEVCRPECPVDTAVVDDDAP
jgi:DNA-binding MarR family transcriptional regulator